MARSELPEEEGAGLRLSILGRALVLFAYSALRSGLYQQRGDSELAHSGGWRDGGLPWRDLRTGRVATVRWGGRLWDSLARFVLHSGLIFFFFFFAQQPFVSGLKRSRVRLRVRIALLLLGSWSAAFHFASPSRLFDSTTEPRRLARNTHLTTLRCEQIIRFASTRDL
jgi:hypothetical protein